MSQATRNPRCPLLLHSVSERLDWIARVASGNDRVVSVHEPTDPQDKLAFRRGAITAAVELAVADLAAFVETMYGRQPLPMRPDDEPQDPPRGSYLGAPGDQSYRKGDRR